MLRQQKLKTLILIIVFSSITFAFGWYLGGRGYTVEVESGSPKVQIINKEAEQKPEAIDFSTFWQVWEILNTRHVDRPLDPQKLFYGALKGLAAAVGDPYTAFLPPQENKEVKDNLNGRYEGVGAELGIRNNQLTVVSPLDGSPAQKAGVRPGDIILEVDGAETSSMSLSEAVQKIRGPAGTAVRLTLKRGEGEPFEVKITRQQITIKSISWEKKEEGVVYIRIARFGEQTNRDWDNAVSEILTSHLSPLTSIILDVRSNPGGYLQASVHIASEFVNSGVIVYEDFGPPEAGRQSRQEFRSDHRGRLTSVPVVVLIDEGSASASEILAAALRDLHGAQLVGQKSFGKGTVQDAVELGDGSSVHVTIARWLTPKGENIDGVGLPVDIEVQRTEEDINAGRDSQLEKAIEIAKRTLSAKIKAQSAKPSSKLKA